MNMNCEWNRILIIIISTFLISAFLVPVIKKTALHVGALDLPNKRKVHTKKMPRMGGVAIFGAFLTGYMFFAESSIQMLSILIGSFIIILLGIIDDIKPIPASYKFITQIIAACVIVFYGGIFLDEITFLGLIIKFPQPINYFVTILFVVSITNAINLIDGLDGLASGVSSIYFATISFIAIILNKMGGLDVVLSLIMLGSTLGFLFHNFPPAKIFMGDSGSLFLGFIISVISLLGFKSTTLTSLIIPMLILAVPIFDTGLAIARRTLKGESVGTPDKEHLHHQLLKMKYSTKKTVLIIYFINVLFALVSILYVLGDSEVAMFIYSLLMIVLLFFILKTDILYEHNKNKKRRFKNEI